MNLPSQARIRIKVWPQHIDYLCMRCSHYATSSASPVSGESRSMWSADSLGFARKVLSAKHTASLRLLRLVGGNQAKLSARAESTARQKG